MSKPLMIIPYLALNFASKLELYYCEMQKEVPELYCCLHEWTSYIEAFSISQNKFPSWGKKIEKKWINFMSSKK